MNYQIPGIRGVTLRQKATGGTWYVRLRINGKQVNPSTETNDQSLAQRIATDLLALVQNPADKQERLARAVEIFRAYTSGSDVYNDVQKRLETARKNAVVMVNDDESMEEHNQRVRANKDYVNLLKQKQELEESYKKQAEEFKIEIAKLQARNRELEGLIKATGSRITSKMAAVRMEDAQKKFMAEGHRSKSKNRDNLESITSRFVAYIGEDANVWDVQPDKAIDWLEDVCDDLGSSWLRQTYLAVNQFMRFASQGNWNEYPLKEWHRKNGVTEEKEWFWLEPEESNELIEKVREHFGDYWADAALIQRGCGFRPEELGFLQTKNVKIDGKQASIFVDKLYNEKGEVWRTLKTLKSRDTVNVPSWAVDAVKRRMKAGGLVLFPRSEEAQAPARWFMYPEFDVKHQLWPDPNKSYGQTFSSHLRERLREAAKQIKGLAAKSGKIMARTFRATCGRELLLAGKDVNDVASVLRDNPDTIRRHYARILAADVSTERDEGKKPKKKATKKK